MKPLPTYAGLGLETPDEVFRVPRGHFSRQPPRVGLLSSTGPRRSPIQEKSQISWTNGTDSSGFKTSTNRFRALCSLSTRNFPRRFLHCLSGTELAPPSFRLSPRIPIGAKGLRNFDFSLPAVSAGDVELALEFVSKSGLRQIFEQGGVSRVRDFLLGAEAGVDSNARKNRGGNAMTHIVAKVLADHCADGGFELDAGGNS